jgi:hypothetical protein
MRSLLPPGLTGFKRKKNNPNSFRYFPEFATESPNNTHFTRDENFLRDISTFFAHAIQETGENDAGLYE